MYVCVCKAINEDAVRQAVDRGAADFPALQEELGVGTCCGNCKSAVASFLDELLAQGTPPTHHHHHAA